MQLSKNLLALTGEMPSKGIKDSASTRANGEETDVSVDDERPGGLDGVL